MQPHKSLKAVYKFVKNLIESNLLPYFKKKYQCTDLVLNVCKIVWKGKKYIQYILS